MAGHRFVAALRQPGRLSWAVGRLLPRNAIAGHNRFTLGSGISSQSGVKAMPVPAIAVGTMWLFPLWRLLKLHHNQSLELRDVDDKTSFTRVRRHVGGSARGARSSTTRRPIRLGPPRWRTIRRRKTTRSAGSRATRWCRTATTFSRSTERGEYRIARANKVD
jgi:hypothetical protein